MAMKAPKRPILYRTDTRPCLKDYSRRRSYHIILNKKSGTCYVWKKKVKTPGFYRKYLPEYSSTIAKEYGVEYKPRNKK